MSFAEAIQKVNLTTAHAVTFEPSKIWYHNGERKAKTPGTFYTRASEFSGGLGAPWAPEERFEGEQGYATASLKIAVLAVRQQAFRKNEIDPKAPPTWLPKWEQGASIYTEVLCLMEGTDAPVVWACKGLTGKAVTGKGGIIPTYQNGLLKEAMRIAKRPLPPWAFWLPIASKRTADGKIAYEDTGFGSFVTPPALHLPENPLDALFVGAEALAAGEDALAQYPQWEQFKRLPENTVEGEVVGPPALPPGTRNVPQLISDAEVSEY